MANFAKTNIMNEKIKILQELGEELKRAYDELYQAHQDYAGSFIELKMNQLELSERENEHFELKAKIDILELHIEEIKKSLENLS